MRANLGSVVETVIGGAHAPALFSYWSRAEQDDCRTCQAHDSSHHIPLVGAQAFDSSQPEERRNNVYATVSSVRSPGGAAFHERE